MPLWAIQTLESSANEQANNSELCTLSNLRNYSADIASGSLSVPSLTPKPDAISSLAVQTVPLLISEIHKLEPHTSRGWEFAQEVAQDMLSGKLSSIKLTGRTRRSCRAEFQEPRTQTPRSREGHCGGLKPRTQKVRSPTPCHSG
jgi:hypothetical protein